MPRQRNSLGRLHLSRQRQPVHPLGAERARSIPRHSPPFACPGLAEDGARAKKRSAWGATLYFDANAEYDTGTLVFTRYPHMDIKWWASTGTSCTATTSPRSVTDMNGAIVEDTAYATFIGHGT